MSIEVLPVGTRCSLACRMCFQNNIRNAGNQSDGSYDMAAMKRALEKENYHFTAFGGEPLLMPIDDLEELWRWGLEKFGQNGIQTSAAIVTEKHHELFKKYKVHVGISIEGPGELNEIRWAGSEERTRKTTERAEETLYRLIDEGAGVSVITTLNRGNASPNRLPSLLDWFEMLDQRGLKHVNLHLMEIDDEQVRREWALTEDETITAFLALAGLQSELKQLRFLPFTDMVQLLLGNNLWERQGVGCTWNACDPYTTRAVRGINGQGELINCSRVNKQGVDMQKADQELLIRPLALYHIPQDRGGCQGCRFWFACKGHCPGEAIGGDWRRKTEHCRILQRLFEAFERRLSELGFRPVSLDDKRRVKVETALLTAFKKNDFAAALGTGATKVCKTHGDSPHGDSSHGDRGHGDHTDAAKPNITHGDHVDAT